MYHINVEKVGKKLNFASGHLAVLKGDNECVHPDHPSSFTLRGRTELE